MIKYKRLVSLYRSEDPDPSSSDQELPQGKNQHGAKPERDGHYPVHPISLGPSPRCAAESRAYVGRIMSSGAGAPRGAVIRVEVGDLRRWLVAAGRCS